MSSDVASRFPTFLDGTSMASGEAFFPTLLIPASVLCVKKYIFLVLVHFVFTNRDKFSQRHNVNRQGYCKFFPTFH